MKRSKYLIVVIVGNTIIWGGLAFLCYVPFPINLITLGICMTTLLLMIETKKLSDLENIDELEL